MQIVHVKLNPGFPWQNQHSTRKETLFSSKFDLNLRKKLLNCYIWNAACYGVETETLRKLGQKYLGSFEMWCWKKMEKIIWTDRVKN